MSKLCKPVPDAQRRTPVIKFRVNAIEALEIQKQAQIRNLNVSEYMRRVLLHRRADVKIETEMILELRQVAAAIRSLHATYVETGYPPPEHQLGPVICRCIEAIVRLARY